MDATQEQQERISKITTELQELSVQDDSAKGALEIRDIRRAELLSEALKNDAYKIVAKSVTAYAKLVGITRAYVYQLAGTWDSDTVRPHLEDIGPARAIAISQAEQKGLEPAIIEHLIDRAPSMTVSDLKGQIKAEMSKPDEAKDASELAEELESVMSTVRRYEAKIAELNERAAELRALIQAAT